MSFSDWFVLLRMSSKLIYVVLCCRIPLRLNNLPLYVSTRFSLSIHPRMETLVISIYLILHMVLQLTWKNQHLFEILIPIIWDKFRSEITGTYSSPIFGGTSLVFRTIVILLSIVATLSKVLQYSFNKLWGYHLHCSRSCEHNSYEEKKPDLKKNTS